MNKYSFTQYKKIDSIFFRLDVYPFLILYTIQFSILSGKILNLSERITIVDIYNSIIYLINFISSLNSTDQNQKISNDLIINDELQIIIDNVPIKYIISLIITLIFNILVFLMTNWNIKFKCIVCYDKIKNDTHANNYLSFQTTHVLVQSSKYKEELCPLKYSTCIEHINKLKSMINITKIKSVNITRINNSFIIQIDAADFLNYRHELEKLLKNDNSNNRVEWNRIIKYEKKIFIYNENHKKFIKAKYPINLSLKSYFNRFLHQGGLNKNEILSYNNIYGINNYEIEREKFLDLFIQQIISPFFLFQIFCVLLWILDEYWQMSLFTLFMLCTLEAQMVFRRIKESDELRSMRRPPSYIFVFRDNTWKYIITDHLLPGDIIAFSSNKDDLEINKETDDQEDITSIAPCDFLLLSGNITVNEAMLTGECTPKMKVPINISDQSDDSSSQNLCIDRHKNHIIFAGTNVILTRSSCIQDDTFQSIIKRLSNDYKNNENLFDGNENKTKNISYMKYNNNKMICIGYVLRTGFNTYQGKLIRTISSSSEKITSNSFEALLFLCLLIICSLIASGYILYNGINDPTRNKFKLILSCIHIITSVIPPEFPITLSIAVTMAVVQLTKKKIYCTEPFRIPFSGKLDVCAFDKTGTLTSDKMNLHGLFGINLKNNDKESCIIFGEDDNNDEINNKKEFNKDNDIPFLSNIIMGCCNGLSLNGKVIVGDPMEKSIKKISCWRINQSENSYYSKLYNSRLNIIKRYPFSPEEQRMTIIAQLDVEKLLNNQKTFSDNYSSELSIPKPSSYGIVLSKGSPEIMMNFFKDINVNMYKEIVHQCTKQGYRILALGAKYCSNLKDIYNNNKREFFENELIFCGFLALYCPIKKHSKSVIEQLNYSGHKSIMITGDNILTAFHVAKNVSITNKEDILILSKDDNNSSEYIWKYSDGNIYSNFNINFKEIESLTQNFCIGITGNVFQSLIEKYGIESLSNLISLCNVYARMSPKDKQTLISLYNKLGNMTLMCGDGTNDVGALKHSHVGISLLSNENNKDEDTKKKKVSFFDIKKDIERRVRQGEKISKSQIQKEILKEFQNMDEIPKVKLGDASIASPFTHKGESPNSVIKLIRYGRATLTTVLLMYKLMGLNSIVSAFSMSVLAYDGVKFGDFQTTFESIIMSGLFFLVLRNKPSKKLVREKPPNSIFNPFVFISFILQAAIHLFVIYVGWKLTINYRPLNYSTAIDGPFEPNIVNTTMFYLYTASHLSCFLSNAQGYPFTESLLNNKYLIYVSFSVIIFLITTILGIFPSINYLFSLELFENINYKFTILGLVFIDIFGTFIVNYILNNLHLSKYD